MTNVFIVHVLPALK